MKQRRNLGRRHYDVTDVAQLYGVADATVYEWLKSGRLAGMKMSAAPKAPWRISEAALQEFDQANVRNRCSTREAATYTDDYKRARGAIRTPDAAEPGEAPGAS